MDKISKVRTEGGVHSILKKPLISCLVSSTSLVQHITPSFKNLICNDLKYSYQEWKSGSSFAIKQSRRGNCS